MTPGGESSVIITIHRQHVPKVTELIHYFYITTIQSVSAIVLHTLTISVLLHQQFHKPVHHTMLETTIKLYNETVTTIAEQEAQNY